MALVETAGDDFNISAFAQGPVTKISYMFCPVCRVQVFGRPDEGEAVSELFEDFGQHLQEHGWE